MIIAWIIFIGVCLIILFSDSPSSFHRLPISDVTNEPLDNLKRFLLIEGQIKSLANTIANVQSKQQEMNKATLALIEFNKQRLYDHQELAFRIDLLEEKEG